MVLHVLCDVCPDILPLGTVEQNVAGIDDLVGIGKENSENAKLVTLPPLCQAIQI